jgi:hypothetical protein
MSKPEVALDGSLGGSEGAAFINRGGFGALGNEIVVPRVLILVFPLRPALKVLEEK